MIWIIATAMLIVAGILMFVAVKPDCPREDLGYKCRGIRCMEGCPRRKDG